MICTADELCSKDIINIDTGAKIGYVINVEFDMLNGKIASLIASGSERGFTFKKSGCFRIRWEDIAVTGSEAILIRNAENIEEIRKDTKSVFDIFAK